MNITLCMYMYQVHLHADKAILDEQNEWII